ncbi:hypothetical protein EV702DRAFT_1202716 [Suillus placidus]|uniref:Uncharacterized protein n=1 Tax=Suillus placidus TaxID=48579 RepID=A0A9P7CY17_9AGAM|nr:hypothetical protein EV702DRAFT_1202716 [Suillus placidus]
MPRTKVTPKRSAGGRAPRKGIFAKFSRTLPVAEPIGTVPSPKVQEMAHSSDDSELLMKEMAHAKVISSTNAMSVAALVVFALIAYRSRAATYNIVGGITPYYGFYEGSKPVLPSFLPILGQLQFSKRSQMSSIPVLLIHFKLVGFETTSNPIDAVHSYLLPYFPNGGLRLVEVAFDLGTVRKIDEYHQECQALVKDILGDRHYQTVFVAITDHTSDHNGDPFLGYQTADNYIAATVPNFMGALLNPWSEVFKRSKDTTLIFLGCGALVNHPRSFGGLSWCAGKHKLTSIIAFTAKHFHPFTACHFLTTYAQLVLIEGFTLREAFPSILDQSGLGMHTEVVLMTMSVGSSWGSDPECTRYSYAHATARPWGCPLPMQCAQCGCPTKWKRIKADVSEMSATFRCSFRGCGKGVNGSESYPAYTYSCTAPKGSKLLQGKK